MELEKIQKFLNNKHKFDRKKEDYEVIADLNQKASIIGKLIEKKEYENMDTVIGRYILDLVQLCNTYNIDLTQTIRDKLKYGL